MSQYVVSNYFPKLKVLVVRSSRVKKFQFEKYYYSNIMQNFLHVFKIDSLINFGMHYVEIWVHFGAGENKILKLALPNSQSRFEPHFVGKKHLELPALP